jgi:hypothetical protein
LRRSPLPWAWPRPYRPDLSQARQIDDWVARGEAVAEALRETARTSHGAVRETLDGRRVDYQPFWANNAIFVHSGEAALAQRIAARPEVEGLYAPVEYELIQPDPAVAEHQINALEWGVANIKWTLRSPSCRVDTRLPGDHLRQQCGGRGRQRLLVRWHP